MGLFMKHYLSKILIVLSSFFGGVHAQPVTPVQGAVTEFKKIDTVVGTGMEAKAGANVSVHYTGWLFDTKSKDNKGKKFDSSVDRGQPFGFPLGGGRVIKGWDDGLLGLKIGGKRTIHIPSELGYGARGAGKSIPPHSNLIFEVELMEILG